MRFVTYILDSSSNRKTYVGHTSNFNQRFFEHNAGKVKAARAYKPWKLLYKEIFLTLKEAKDRERYWKTGGGRRKLRKIIEGSRSVF